MAAHGPAQQNRMARGRNADARGRRAEPDLGLVLGKRLTLIGSTLRSRSTADRATLAATMVAQVWPGFADGSLRPVVHAVRPLEEAAAAHEGLGSSAHVGKIVLTC